MPALTEKQIKDLQKIFPGSVSDIIIQAVALMWQQFVKGEKSK